jgi:UDP-N-acetylmuramoyl-tripeptide--D-alanyl-D-alanine ligase
MTMPINLGVATLTAIVNLAWAGLRAQKALHMLQLDSYANDRFLRWLAVDPARRLIDWPSGLCQLVFLALALVQPEGLVNATIPLAGALLCQAGLLVYAYLHAEQPKKPLVYTGRARRILGTSFGLSLVILGGSTWFALSSVQSDLALPLSYNAAFLILLAGLVVVQLSPLSTVLANVLLIPVQGAINQTYLRRARKRLREVNPLVIGITGSYGKTSTKYLLEHLLASRHRVLKTPLSYNTLMGLCRVINDSLEADRELFIAEMGAYRRGDIKELCDFVRPTIGILTAIGPQHLERFKSIENV